MGLVAGAAATATAYELRDDRAQTGPPVALPDPAAPASGDMSDVDDLARLEVAGDGCGVVRTGPSEDLDGLMWNVRDADGFTVLERNALGDTHYRYYVRGDYVVVLKAWGGSYYVPVSNEVDISC